MRTVGCLIVIPRSRSRSMESSTWSTAFLGSMAPVRASSRSARVDLPWSMWATMEKFRIRESATKFRISRDDFVFPDYGAGGDPRASSDHGPGAYHACPEDGGLADRDALPEDGLFDAAAPADAHVVSEHAEWAHAGLGLQPDCGAENRRPPDDGPGGDGHARPHPHVTAPGSGRGEGRVHEAFEEVHLREAGLLRAPDVPPVRPGREAVGGDPAFQEAGEKVALHGDGAARRDQVEQLALEEVDARVDGVGADLLARRLLQEAPDPAVGLRLHQPEGRRVLHGREVDAGPGPAGLVGGEHPGEVHVGQDVAVQDHQPARRQRGGVLAPPPRPRPPPARAWTPSTRKEQARTTSTTPCRRRRASW